MNDLPTPMRPFAVTKAYRENDGRCEICNRHTDITALDYRAPYYSGHKLLCVYCRATCRDHDPGVVSIEGHRPETIAEISTKTIARCLEGGYEFPPIEIWPRFVMVPQNRIEIVIDQLVERAIQISGRMPSNKRKIPGHKTPVDRQKMGQQQGGCCYCGVDLLYREQKLISRAEDLLISATWEHVKNLSDGGDWTKANLMVSCFFCNNLRNEMKVDADDFLIWLKGHRAAFDALRKTKITRLIEKGYSR